MARTRALARHPQGWFYMVEQLAAAPDRAAFLRRMLDLQCKVVAGEYGAIWLASEDGTPTPACAWPENVETAPPQSNPALQRLRQAAASGFEKKMSHVLRVESEAPMLGGPSGGAYAFVTVMRAHGKVEAVATVVAYVTDEQVIQSTAAVREVAAGLYDGFEARKAAVDGQAEVRRVRRAMAILAVCHEAPNFDGSGIHLVNELSQQFHCARVSLGWLKGRRVKVISMSDTEHVRRHSEEVALTELAMAECLDQEQPILYPIPQDAEPLLKHAVTQAHRRLADSAGTAARHVLSIPLRHRDEWVGVLTLERQGELFDAGEVSQAQLVGDVVSPHLVDRHVGDRWLAVHAWHTVRDAAAYLVGPKHVAWKLVTLVLAAALLYVAFGSWNYRITAPFVLKAEHRRATAAPFEGTIAGVYVEKGQQVDAGQPLAQLDTRMLGLELDQALHQLRDLELQHSLALSEAMQDESKRVATVQAETRIKALEAHIRRAEEKIEQATLRSPIAGRVLVGDWKDRVGTTVEQGTAMFEIAPLNGPDDLLAVLHVNEEDVDDLRRFMVAHAAVVGEMSPRSEPNVSHPLVLLRVVPIAKPSNGVNGFEVYCRIGGPDARQLPWGLDPEMQGTAKLDVGQRRIYWILTHRMADKLRLWLWY